MVAFPHPSLCIQRTKTHRAPAERCDHNLNSEPKNSACEEFAKIPSAISSFTERCISGATEIIYKFSNRTWGGWKVGSGVLEGGVVVSSNSFFSEILNLLALHGEPGLLREQTNFHIWIHMLYLQVILRARKSTTKYLARSLFELKKLNAFNACGGKYVTPDSLRTSHFPQVLSHNNALHTDDTKRQEV